MPYMFTEVPARASSLMTGVPLPEAPRIQGLTAEYHLTQREFPGRPVSTRFRLYQLVERGRGLRRKDGDLFADQQVKDFLWRARRCEWHYDQAGAVAAERPIFPIRRNQRRRSGTMSKRR